MDENSWKLLKNGWKWLDMAGNALKWLEMPGHLRTWLEWIRTSSYLTHSSYQWLKKYGRYDGTARQCRVFLHILFRVVSSSLSLQCLLKWSVLTTWVFQWARQEGVRDDEKWETTPGNIVCPGRNMNVEQREIHSGRTTQHQYIEFSRD